LAAFANAAAAGAAVAAVGFFSNDLTGDQLALMAVVPRYPYGFKELR
jgi:hypothetical protein